MYNDPSPSLKAARLKQLAEAEGALADCEATIGRIRDRLRSAVWTERAEEAAYFGRLQLLRLEQVLASQGERQQPRKGG